MQSSEPRVGFRFVAVFVLGLVFQGARAMNDLNNEDQVGEKNHLRVDKRSVSTNATPNIPDILKRLQALEEKHDKSLKSVNLTNQRLQELEKSISAMEENRRGKDQNSIGGMNIAEKRSQPLRERRAVKKNSTEDILERLQDLEKRVEALLQPRNNFEFLAKYFQERDGRNYGLGLMGPPGPPGPKGESGKSGVKYVRWGRTTCPSGAEIVYKGIIGGGDHLHQGGGANYLCLPLNPKYDKYKDGHQSAGYVYGSEYQVAFGFNPFKQNIHDFEAVCAVCFAKTRGSMLMMPARNDCPSGWTEEYHGYLMTEYYKHNNQRDYICVDEDAEYVPGTQANKDGALLYPVEGVCGSLPCKPYVNGRELTCAVCTK